MSKARMFLLGWVVLWALYEFTVGILDLVTHDALWPLFFAFGCMFSILAWQAWRKRERVG